MFAIIVVTLVAASTSFLCSIMEAALYSIPPSKIEELRKQGNRRGIRLSRLRAKVDEPISAILALNTIANTVGAVIAGSLVKAYYDEAAVAIYSAIFTLIILFASEIIPKTLGVTYANRLAPILSLPIVIIIRALVFLVKPSLFLTKYIRQHGGADADAPSEQQILALAEMGAKAGTLLEEEARWAMNALRLNDMTAKDLMTPRTVVYMLSADLPLAQVSEHSEHWTYSRLPIVKDNDPDRVEGIVHRREVFDQLVKRSAADLEKSTLGDLAHPAHFIPETVRCNELLRRFLSDRQQIFIVTNEYGGMEGIISLEDVIEYLLGEEIVDLHDKYADMQEEARRRAERRINRHRRRQPGKERPSERPNTAKGSKSRDRNQ